MQTLLMMETATLLRRRDEASGGGGLGCFVALLIVGIVVFLVLRGRRDKQEQLGAAHRPMTSGPLDAHSFANPYPKCPTCGASGDRMKQAYDGLRKVTWTCGYCGSVAGVQDLRDDELPPSVRQRLGLDAAPGMAPGQPGYYPPQQGGGMGGLLTGMMIGSMMGGGHHDHDRDGWGGGSGGDGWSDPGGSDGTGGDWGGSGGSDWGDSGGSDWGDSGGGDSGGSDW